MRFVDLRPARSPCPSCSRVTGTSSAPTSTTLIIGPGGVQRGPCWCGGGVRLSALLPHACSKTQAHGVLRLESHGWQGYPRVPQHHEVSTTIIKDLAQAASVSSIGDGRWVVDQDVIESMTPHLWVRGGLSWETLSLTPK